MCDVSMILNVSGRTDIVAFYTKWFMNRYKEGYVMVRNPFNYHLVNEIYFEDDNGTYRNHDLKKKYILIKKNIIMQ